MYISIHALTFSHSFRKLILFTLLTRSCHILVTVQFLIKKHCIVLLPKPWNNILTSDSGFSLDWGHCTVFLDKTLNTYSVSLIQVLGGTSKLNNGTTYDTSACTLTGLSSCTIIHIIICELYYFLCSIHGHGPPMIPVH